MHSSRNSARMMSPSRGFSIVELIVAMSVFIVITAVLLFNYNSLNKRLALNTLAHQIAQWVRQTQVSAMSVKSSQTVAGKFNTGYGLHFNRSTPDEFIFFADLDGNNRYDSGGPTCGVLGVECEKVIRLPSGSKIRSLCGEASAINVPAIDCGTFDNAENFDIVFLRPDPDPTITGDYIMGNATQYARTEITIVAPSGYTRTIEVWTTGQVSVR